MLHLLLLQAGFGLGEASVLAAIYPVTWGMSQLVTGAVSDHWGRKRLIVAGMLLQAAALGAMTVGHSSGSSSARWLRWEWVQHWFIRHSSLQSVTSRIRPGAVPR